MDKLTLTNGHVCKTTDRTTGRDFAGTYYPAFVKNGLPTSAKWCGSIAVNGRDYTNREGVRVKAEPKYYDVTFWNSKNAGPGKSGMADICAKNLSIGKEIICVECTPQNYLRRVFEDGQPLLSPKTGQPLLVKAVNYSYLGNLEFNNDSRRQVAAEIAAWVQGQANFFSRPPLWDQLNTGDNTAWRDIIAVRQGTVFTPGDETYGFAKVGPIPAGAQFCDFNKAPVGASPVAAANQLNAQQIQEPQAPVPPMSVEIPTTVQQPMTAGVTPSL